VGVVPSNIYNVVSRRISELESEIFVCELEKLFSPQEAGSGKEVNPQQSGGTVGESTKNYS
jgi:hypothetical protein